MFGLLLRSELLQGSAVRTWNCVLNIANFFRYKFNSFRQPVMPRPRRRHHSRSRSRSHSHDRDREAKRRRVESPDSSHHRRSVSVDTDVTTPQKSVSSPQEIGTSPEKSAIMSPVQDKALDSHKKRQMEKEEREKKRQEERMKLKQEKEEQRLKERKEKEELKRREREEKEELKRKEREEKEEQKRKEKEEKEEQKRKEREEKELQKKKEKEEREEQKRKEKELKELRKQQELEEKNRDRKKKEELIEKEKAAFANFFVPRKSASSSELKKVEEEKLAFMPFEAKSDMRLAPLSRRRFSAQQKEELVEKMREQTDSVLYLLELKGRKLVGTSWRTWPLEEDDDEVVIVEDSDLGEKVEEQPQGEKMRVKLLKFHENQRPAYFGTWRKSSREITPRRPFAKDSKFFDYEVESDDDWEEEEPGESLHGSDDEEKENEPDDYEVDNDFFVPHGYLSDEEAQAEEQQTPETQQEKLKFLQMEFDEEMKSKTEKIKPRLIGCIWQSKLGPKIQDAVHKFLEDRMMILTGGTITIPKRDLIASTKKSASKTTPGKKQLTKDLIPDFIKLIHGNSNSQTFIVNEFLSYLSAKAVEVPVSKFGLCSQLKQLAKWRKCPEEGVMFHKQCWYVDEEIRSQFSVILELPNKWSYSTGGTEDGARKKLVI